MQGAAGKTGPLGARAPCKSLPDTRDEDAETKCAHGNLQIHLANGETPVLQQGQVLSVKDSAGEPSGGNDYLDS